MKGILLGDIIINPKQITRIIKTSAAEFTIYFAVGDKIEVVDNSGAIWKYFAENCEPVPGVEETKVLVEPHP